MSCVKLIKMIKHETTLKYNAEIFKDMTHPGLFKLGYFWIMPSRRVMNIRRFRYDDLKPSQYNMSLMQQELSCQRRQGFIVSMVDKCLISY